MDRSIACASAAPYIGKTQCFRRLTGIQDDHAESSCWICALQSRPKRHSSIFAYFLGSGRGQNCFAHVGLRKSCSSSDSQTICRNIFNVSGLQSCLLSRPAISSGLAVDAHQVALYRSGVRHKLAIGSVRRMCCHVLQSNTATAVDSARFSGITSGVLCSGPWLSSKQIYKCMINHGCWQSVGSVSGWSVKLRTESQHSSSPFQVQLLGACLSWYAISVLGSAGTQVVL